MLKKVAIVLGTRPEAVKLAPVILAMCACSKLETRVVVTGQHREMLHQTLGWFGITADTDLQIMTPKQSLADITCRSLQGLESRFQADRPDLVIVQGDTTTTFAAALAAFYQQIPVGHVEAGLRTGVANDPFPEEMNRRITSQLATLHFAPTPQAVRNLTHDGVTHNVFMTGNTVIDALLTIAGRSPECPIPGLDWQKQRVLLATVHRRENWGAPLQQIAYAMRDILDKHPDTALLLPLHKNPTVREPLQAILGDHPQAFLCEPLDYPQLVGAMGRSTLILTDSGGIQEEAPALGKPVLVLRETTERPEAIEAGVARKVGTERHAIVDAAHELLSNSAAYDQMARAVNPFGDGKATERILEVTLKYLNL
jgi:UDP-N-acetylglucosamine 2-epimerase (non-hydrolysing)